MTTAPTLYWIDGPWTGRLAISARPRGGDWLEDEIAGWREAGITVVSSLLVPEETSELGLTDEARLCRAAGIHFFSLPIPDLGVPQEDSSAHYRIDKIVQRLNHGEHVAIHCRQSVGRSGMIVAAVLMSANVPLDEALRRITASRGIEVPETHAQFAWLQRL